MGIITQFISGLPENVAGELIADLIVRILAKLKKELVNKNNPEYLLRQIEDDEYRVIPVEIRDALKGFITECRSDHAAHLDRLDRLICLAEARLPPRLADQLDPLKVDWDQVEFEPPPSSLLLAKYGIVPFRGRETELKGLHDWCDRDGRVRLRLYTGAGGMGKTRLFIEFAARMREGMGWKAGFLRDDKVLDNCRFDSEEPLLVVIDYAERRTQAVRALVRGFRAAKDAPKVRIVLLARSEQEWWEALRRTDGDLAEFLQSSNTQGPIPISEPSADPDEKLAAYLEAVEAFRVRLNRAPVTVNPPDLSKKDFDRILVVHMAALAAVDGKVFAGKEHLLDDLAEREERFLVGRLANRGLKATLDQTLFRAAVLATLVGGAPSRNEACSLVGRAPIGTGPDGADLEALTDILMGAYPGSRPGNSPRLNGIEPDLFGEHILYRWMKKNKDLRLLEIAVDPALGVKAAAHMLTVLTRLAWYRSEAEEWLRHVLAHDPGRMIPLAVDVALETGDPVGRVAAEVLEESRDTTIAMAIVDEIPDQTTALRELAVIAERLHLEARLRSADTNSLDVILEIAQCNRKLGVRLSDLGKWDEAIKVTEIAVDYFRNLNIYSPGEYLSDLAGCLNNLGGLQFTIGMLARSLEFVLEATNKFNILNNHHRGGFEGDLANSFNTLGIIYSQLGMREIALSASQQSTQIFRSLASTNPKVYLPELAMSLNTLGKTLSELARHEEAFEVTHEAICLYRDLSAKMPDAFLPALALSLVNLGTNYSVLDKPIDALKVTREATNIYRDLAGARPGVFLPDLSSSLNNLAVILSSMGKYDEALLVDHECVQIRRSLANDRPRVYLSDLATSLSNLMVRQSQNNMHQESLLSGNEAVQILRSLATVQPKKFLPQLATTLSNLGNVYSELGRFQEALSAGQEATDIYRELVKEEPNTFLLNLARTVGNLGNRYTALGLNEDACKETQEAVRLFRELDSKHPAIFRHDLAKALNNLGNKYINVGQIEIAIDSAKEAISIYNDLAAKQPETILPERAFSYSGLGHCLSAGGDYEASLGAFNQAIKLLVPQIISLPSIYSQAMHALVEGYLGACDKLNIPPDMSIIDPIIAKIKTAI